MTQHRFQKVTRLHTRLADDVYEQLFSGIISGRVGAGDRLIQETIAQEIDVSRTPVREALLRLEREGIIEPAGRRGFVVRELTEQEVRDSYQAREAIEGFAARLVAANGSKLALDRIADTISGAAHQRQGSIESAYRANEDVHRVMVEASGNTFLVELFDAVWGRQVAMRLYADLFNEVDLVSSFDDDHVTLLEALCSGDEDRAATAAIDHIRDGLELQLRAIALRNARLGFTDPPGDTAHAQY